MRTTIKDIAAKTGLSVTTVSLVLNNRPSKISQETRELVLKTAQELCYRPNQLAVGLIKKRTKTIGLILSDIRNSFFSTLAKGVEDECWKNGWTGDAQLACETGLWNYHAQNAYLHFVRLLSDTQRPSGQLPGIAPSGGWGYNWGSGPAWDSMLFEGVWQIYLFRGDAEPAHEQYDAMKRYVEYCRGMSENNLVRFGLGDWCHWDRFRIAPVELTSSGYYYNDIVRLTRFATLFGKETDAEEYTALAESVKKSFNQTFYKGDGIYADGSMTALSAALYFNLAEQARELTARKLAELVRARQHRADFGILGAKYVPRVLADYGFAEDAFRMITQPEFPGWGYWVKQGATSLWEHWNGCSSQNHIMFGDISAWMYQYLGGATPCFETPGFRRFRLRPCLVPQLDFVKMSHETPHGPLRVSWQRTAEGVRCDFEIPENCTAVLELPGRKAEEVRGKLSRTV